MIRLVQLTHPKHGRRVAVVEADELRLLDIADSIFRLAESTIAKKISLAKKISASRSRETLDYDAVYAGKSKWRLLPAFDHPGEPARCLVTGTGLTHRKSAENRQAMHAATAPLSDSMKMYQLGLEGGRPARGKIGVSPEWFYKGCGTILRAHGEPLDVPAFALDGGDEAEVAGAYLIDPSGAPRRVGLVLANEFSDHVLEQKNYLYLAPSKLRTCALGPELIVDADFTDARGTTRILRGKKIIWSKPFATGGKNMCHTVANLEHHHFKYPAHRRPGDAHVHFFGADAFSFGDGVKLEDGDVMEIELAGFGRALRNPIRIERKKPKLVRVRPV
ncbi:MAG: GguC protein [Pedosphaera sp.]|nr:GguC protein [Pedosphaera sp.]